MLSFGIFNGKIATPIIKFIENTALLF